MIELSKHQVMDVLLSRLGDGVWFLRVLSAYGETNKERIWELINERYLESNPGGKPLLNSRYALDTMAARLEGAGLVDYREIGRVRIYRITTLGHEIISHLKKK